MTLNASIQVPLSSSKHDAPRPAYFVHSVQAVLGNISPISSPEILCLRKKDAPAPPAAPATNPPFFLSSPLGLYALGCGSQNLQSFSTINENRHHHQTRYARSTRCRYAALPSCSLLWREEYLSREAISRFWPGGSGGGRPTLFCGGAQTPKLPAGRRKMQYGDRFSEKRPDR